MAWPELTHASRFPDRNVANPDEPRSGTVCATWGSTMVRRGTTTDTALETVGARADIGGLVRELRELYYIKGIELMLRVGELILERLYGGNVTRWHARHRKDISFRKLQRHPDLPFKASTLSRAVSMYLLSRRRPDLLQMQNVSQSHLQEVLNLDTELQDYLLGRVEGERWSVQKLRSEVTQRLLQETKGRARARTLTFSRQLRSLKTVVEHRLLLRDTEQLTALEHGEARVLLDTAQRLCEQAEVVARLLATHVAALECGVADTDPGVTTERPVSVLVGPGGATSQHWTQPPPADSSPSSKKPTEGKHPTRARIR
jgi:hypothetical protein